MDINTELTAIKGIGEKTAGLFSKLHIMTVGQLLTHYPRDYDKMESTVTVSGLVPGRVCVVRASVIGTPSTKHVRNLLI
ncbi:MAG: ATP-dependent DNA helicase RecG, partial [Eisenbergiella massiliensis]